MEIHRQSLHLAVHSVYVCVHMSVFVGVHAFGVLIWPKKFKKLNSCVCLVGG